MDFLSNLALEETARRTELSFVDETNQYEFISKNKYFEIHLEKGGLLPKAPDSSNTPSEFKTYPKLIQDLVEVYEFWVVLKEMVIRYPLTQNQIMEEIGIKKLVEKTALDFSEILEIKKDYQDFLAGKRSWMHSKEAKRHNISVSTLRTYLKELGIYDVKKH